MGSHPCGKCLLYNLGGERNGEKTKLIKSKNCKIIILNKDLSCKKFWIYAVKCNICDVVQTITSFLQRWCSHVYNWKKMTTSETNDRAELKLHYANKHPTSSKTFEKAYSITLKYSTSNHSNLDYLENT